MGLHATPKDLLPDAHCVLGTMLRPFSLGHHLLLTRLDLAFAGDPAARPDPEEFSLAVFLCAAASAEMEACYLAGNLATEHARWTRRLRRHWWQRSRFDAETERAKFKTYLADGYRRPPVMRELTSLIKFSAPWETLLLCRLAAHGFPPAEARELYLPAAWYCYHTCRELQQADRLDDPARWRQVFYTRELAEQLGRIN